ncbi:MAG: hypothetical protein LBK72_06795 [Bifidobacteriaceae bacterium]|nr:hypothetical protein [Bifidobacteriaceae bacterium]
MASAGAVIVGTPGVAATGGPAAVRATETIAPAIAPTTPASVGAWRPIKPVNVLGGTSGRSVAASRDVTVTLARPGSIPQSRNSWVVSVAVIGAPAVGQLQISTPGKPATGSPSVSYSKGATLTTTLIEVNANGELRLRSSRGIRVAITAQAYLTGADTAKAGPGGTRAIPHYSLVRSDKKLGPDIPASGSFATVTVGGAGGIPTANVRGVWLSVQTHSKSAVGSLGFSKADGGGSPGTAVAEVRRGWATSLVLAPLSADGKILYRVNGGAPTTLRIVAVGYVQASTATDEKTVINNALTLSSNRKATPVLRGTYTKNKVKQKIYSLKVTGTSVPSATTRVIVRLTVAGGTTGGEFKYQRTKSSVRNAKPIVLPKGSVANIAFNQLVGENGTIFVSVPQGGSVLNAAVVATVLKAKSQANDPGAPTGSINPIGAGGAIDLATTPQVTITGLAFDAVSGVRSVAVYRDQTFLGSATVDTTKATPTWSLTTSLAPGTGTVWARIKDFSARYIDTAGLPITVKAPAAGVAVQAPDAVVLAKQQCDAVAAVAANSVAFTGTFDAKPGNVIVCDVAPKAPNGFLRRVVSLRTVSGKTTVTTTQATPLDTLVQGDFDVKDAKLGGATTDRNVKVPAVTQNGVTVSGSLGVTGTASLKLGIATPWADGPLAKSALTSLGYKLGITASTEATVKGAATAPGAATVKTPAYTPAKSAITPASIKLGPIPVVMGAQVTPTVTIEGTGQAGSDATAEVNITGTTGADLTNVQTSAWNPTHTEDATGTSSVRGAAPAAIGGTWRTVVEVAIDGLPGAAVTLNAGVQDTVAPSSSPSPSASASASPSPSGSASPSPSATPSPPPSVPGFASTLVVDASGAMAAAAKFLGVDNLIALNVQVPTWNKTL